MNKDLMFSSSTAEWGTPADFWKALDQEFHFTVDLAAAEYNAKCLRYYSREHSLFKFAHTIKTQVCWLNPVYGDAEQPCKPVCHKKKCVKRGYHVSVYQPGIFDFLQAASDLHHRGNTVVCLIPARTDTEWWHAIVMKCADEVWLLRGRLRFETPQGTILDPAPFPSAVVVMRPRPAYDHRGPIFKSIDPVAYTARHTPVEVVEVEAIEDEVIEMPL